MNRKHLFISFAVVLALGLTLTAWWLSSDTAARLPVARDAGPTVCPTRPPARAASYTVCPDGPPTCAYATIQAAVDAACDGDVVKVAQGTYTGVSARAAPLRDSYYHSAMVTQTVVYINKSITIRGGYTTAFADPPDPDANPTTLDAQGQGRVIFITGNVSTTIEGLRITGGNAAGLGGRSWPKGSGAYDAGGGVYVQNAPLNFVNNQVFGNTAEYGGGIYLCCGNATLTGNVVTYNSGGGLHLGGNDVSVNDNTISYNSGGGLRLGGSNGSASNNIVSYNTAEWTGSGVTLSHGDANLSDNIITFNTTDGPFGGGLLVLYSDATFDRNTITWNTASDSGGGVYLAYSDGAGTNNLIAHNRPGGIAIYNSSLRLLHTTVVHNTGDNGSGISIAHTSSHAPTVSLSNTILVSHTVGIIVRDGSAATLESTLWGAGDWANETDWAGAGEIVTGTINVWGDPDFVDPGAGNYHIGPASAAIDRGVDAGVVDDVDGEPRPQGSGYDIGADEVGPRMDEQAAPNSVHPGEQLTFTIRVTNPSDLTLHAAVTDTLPPHVTLDATSGETLVLPGGATGVTWTACHTPR